MTGEEIVALCKKHTIFEWSAQSAVDPIPVARAKGVYFWTPEGKRYIDFNSQLMSTAEYRRLVAARVLHRLIREAGGW